MSNKLDTKAVKPESKRVLKSKLRFPEFKGEPEWNTEKLRAIASLITERAGNRKCIPMSITSGVGLVSQQEKFGRTIAGNQYENYLVLQKDDFAYNKSATKEFPQGFIAKYSGDEPAAVPNSIFTCFRARKDGIVPDFLDYLFLANLHGKWLQKYIEVSARAHGSLSIDDEDLLSLPIPLPSGRSSRAEQQKISECLTSLDELIAAHGQELDALKAHKKGLTQELFPCEGETQPRLRFPEFRNAGEWAEETFGNIIAINSGKGFKASDYSQTGIRLLQIENVGYGVTKWNQNTIYLPESFTSEYPELVLRSGDIVLALNRPVTNGELKIAKLHKGDEPSILYQRVGKIILLGDSLRFDFAFHICRQFIKQFVTNKSIGSDQPFISLRDLYAQTIFIPLPSEQQKIADCLSCIDELIIANTQKFEALKTHKQGLMQQLFPSPEEVEA